MKNTIIIGTNRHSGLIDFYAVNGEKRYYIFSRKFRKSLYNYFRKGVPLQRLFDFSKAHGNPVIMNTIEQLKIFLKYIEKENNIKLLRGKQFCRKHAEERFIAYYEETA